MSASDTARLSDPRYLGLLLRGNSNALDSSGWSRNGTWSGAATYADGPWGRKVFDLNGTDMKVTAGNVGTVRTVSFWCRPDTTTEELILLSTGNDVMVSGGTITYAGVAATTTYVNGSISTTLAAGSWQHVACVLSADHAATGFAVGTDGTNFGASEHSNVRAYSIALTGAEVLALYRSELSGSLL